MELYNKVLVKIEKIIGSGSTSDVQLMDYGLVFKVVWVWV